MPDQVVIYRPSSTVDFGGWDVTAGGTAHGVLADDNNATYVHSAQNNAGVLKVAFTGPGGVPWTPPARAQIRRVRPFITGECINAHSGRVAVRHRVWVGDYGHPYLEELTLVTSQGIKRHMLSALTTNPWGETWTTGDLAKLRGHYARAHSWDPDRPRLMEAELHVAYNQAPVVTVTGPADPTTTTSTPTITWNYADPELDEQERIHAYVYPESVYSQPGFSVPVPDPSTNVSGAQRPPGAVWAAGPIAGSQRSIEIGTALENGRYRAYVFAADVGSRARYSAPAYKEWQQNVTGPPPPTVTVEVQ